MYNWRNTMIMENLNEIWRDINGYEGYYQASNFGRIKNIKTGRILKQMPQGKANRLFVGLSKDGKTKRCQVSRIIAETFIPNPDNLPQVNHKDENTQKKRKVRSNGFFSQIAPFFHIVPHFSSKRKNTPG